MVSNPSVRVAHHLTFAGECEEAFELYSQIFGGTVLGVRKYADSPLGSQVPPNWQQKVLFASVQVGDYALHGTDHLPNQYRGQPSEIVLVYTLRALRGLVWNSVGDRS